MKELRLADLLVGLSAVTDLGMGQPIGSAARACLLAVRLAEIAGLSDVEARDVYYTSLLQHIGCTAFSHESARFFADEQSVKQATQVTDFNDPKDIFLGYVPTITKAAPPGERGRTLLSALVSSRGITDGYMLSACEVGFNMARRLGLSEGVQQGLLQIFESWNGKGRPRKLKGEAISKASRVALVAHYASLFDRMGGSAASTAAIKKRSGGYLDPSLAETFCDHAETLLSDLATVDVLKTLCAEEPKPELVSPQWRIDETLRAFGDVVDLKAPYFHGHAAAVSSLSERAAERLGLSAEEVAGARRAGCVADVGRAAIANGIWEQPRALHSSEWALVRLHPYHTEQVLDRSETLAPLAPLAGAHHERLDGSGYYRRSAASALPISTRIIAAADSYAAMVEPRPHRAAMTRERAAEELRSHARAGEFDPDVVDALLEAAGHATSRVRRDWPMGLSDRQVEVLRLVADGHSNRAIAEQLHISARTAEHHVQDVYAKIGVSSRAAAALFAMEHNLLGPKDW
ncbi:MAG: HD domain-containing phosphohydrolase [Actinomycetota bacterium]|nr:LuxR C-terminal-related transcriptional regulator [Actinomycetota bacterium]